MGIKDKNRVKNPNIYSKHEIRDNTKLYITEKIFICEKKLTCSGNVPIIIEKFIDNKLMILFNIIHKIFF